MKKFLLVIATALMFGMNVKAEEYFAPGWFIGFKGGAQCTIGETTYGNLISPTAAFNVGYQFRPWFGLRADLSGWQGKGAIDVPGESKYSSYAFNYAQLAFDATFNIIDIFEKKAKKHVVNPYIFAGLGGFFGFKNTEKDALISKGASFAFPWSNTVSMVGRLGAGVDFKAGKRTIIGIEYTANMVGDQMNSKQGTTGKIGDGKYMDLDYTHSLMLSFRWALGDQGKNAKKYAASRAAAKAKKSGMSDAEIAAAAALASAAIDSGCKSLAANYVTAPSVDEYLAAQKAEADRIAAEKAAAEKAAADAAAAAAAAAKAAADKAAADAAAAAAAAAEAMKTQNVFFELNKYVIRESEESKINTIVECLKADPSAKVTVTGHADKETGNSKINLKLSENRANVVAKSLIDKGIDASRIITDFKGDTANPYSVPEQNRVSICVVD